MEELINLVAKVELTADDIIDTRQQIVNLDAKRHKTREALNRLRDIRTGDTSAAKKYWVCVGDMFIRLNYNGTKNIISDEHCHLDSGVEKLRDELSQKVNKLRELEGRPELKFNLKALNKEEILALRTGFKI